MRPLTRQVLLIFWLLLLIITGQRSVVEARPSGSGPSGSAPPGSGPSGSGPLFLPLIMRSPTCEVPGETYNTLSINGPPFTGDAAQNIEYNLGYRGYAPTTTQLQLLPLGPVHDVNAPQFNTLFSDLRLPDFTNAYHRYRWANGQPVDTQSPWGSTVLGLGVTPGEIIHAPDSGYNLGGGHDALVLYAGETRLTLKYTREDSVAVGYTVYIEDICVQLALVSLYQALNANGRTTLPALPGGQPVGRAIGSQIKVAVRDAGHFLDPRSCNDWWQAFSAACH